MSPVTPRIPLGTKNGQPSTEGLPRKNIVHLFEFMFLFDVTFDVLRNPDILAKANWAAYSTCS